VLLKQPKLPLQHQPQPQPLRSPFKTPSSLRTSQNKGKSQFEASRLTAERIIYTCAAAIQRIFVPAIYLSWNPPLLAATGTWSRSIVYGQADAAGLNHTFQITRHGAAKLLGFERCAWVWILHLAAAAGVVP
jgi:hypothetical protein